MCNAAFNTQTFLCVYLYLADRFSLHTGILWCLFGEPGCPFLVTVLVWLHFMFSSFRSKVSCQGGAEAEAEAELWHMRAQAGAL